MSAPATFAAGRLRARRLTAADLPFVQALMSRPELSTHKPVPVPSPPDAIARAHAADLAHWEAHGFGRYVVDLSDEPIGLCALSRRDGMAGLNLSYHLLPEHWGGGLATDLVSALVELARTHLADDGPIYALVRPANPASARVLVKSGFIRAEDLTLGGAPTIRYALDIGPQ